ncbi:MAG: ketoacyl-ACP synthase III [Neisseriaceae bacterium]|nr:ketoacyl-ACP synthase III [Neisseriaceae bacterium]
MTYSRILGVGSFLPAKRVSNDDLAQIVETSDEWIFQRTGIKARHLAADDENTSDLAVKAARNALQQANTDPNEIDLIIVGTVTGDYAFPSTACLVQQKLGITNRCPAFDIQAACAGFMYAMTMADAYIRGGLCKKALIIGAETLSRIVNWQDRNTCVLFGDGAGAAVLGASDEPGILCSKMYADGEFASVLHMDGRMNNGDWTGAKFINMDGQAVFKFAVKALSEVAKETIEAANFPAEKIDWLVPHQANSRIIDATAKHLKLPPEKVILTVAEHANTSAASIPLALDYDIQSGKIQRGQHLLLEGIGGGFAWGAMLLRY